MQNFNQERDAMTRRMLKSKIHRATVTEANIEYEGSVTIDQDLLEQQGRASSGQAKWRSKPRYMPGYMLESV